MGSRPKGVGGISCRSLPLARVASHDKDPGAKRSFLIFLFYPLRYGFCEDENELYARD